VALLVGSAIMTTTAMLIGGPSALAASKGMTCPDGTAVTDSSWNVACSGQTAADATVTITSAKATSLSIKVEPAATDTFVSASGSYNTTDATTQLTYGTQAGANETIDITVTPPGGAAPGGLDMVSPSSGSPVRFYRLIYRK